MEATRSLRAHLADFEAALKARDNTPRYVVLTINRVARILGGCDFRVPSDLDGGKVAGDLKARRGEPERLSAKSSNHLLGAIKGFTRWLVQERRLSEDPLTHLRALNTAPDRRRERRALSDEEISRLLAATETAPARRAMSGRERALVYRCMLYTGLRLGEMKSLTRASFDLEEGTVTVKAQHSKHRQDDLLPLHRDLLDPLRWHLAQKLPGALAFGIPTNHMVQLLKADLTATSVPYRDDQGRVADLHALRHTFVSRLAQSGAHPKVMQNLARHATPHMTLGVYTHLSRDVERQALNALPQLPPTDHDRERATGTIGAASDLRATRASMRAAATGSGCAPRKSPDTSDALLQFSQT